MKTKQRSFKIEEEKGDGGMGGGCLKTKILYIHA
jgi:hypothetical protein